MSHADILPPDLIVLERGWLSSNNILFVGGERTALVDSGYVTHAAQTLALVGNGLGELPLDVLLNTHLHSDHCGGNAALQVRYPGLHTCIPPGDAEHVQRWDEEALSFRATGQQCARFRFDALIRPGEEIVLGHSAWQVHAAPGHDPSSVILFEPATRTLISADALWENGFGVVFPELAGEPSFGDVARTLDLIEGLDPCTVIPGHGSVFVAVKPALITARRRLDGLSREPQKHARHALKVLMKFKLLEWQNVDVNQWHEWLAVTPYVNTVRSRFFAAADLQQLAHELLGELVHAGAASIRGTRIINN